MALMRVCREFGRLPSDIEALTAAEFFELICYLKICDDREREAHEKAKRDADAKGKSRKGRG